MKRVFIYIGMTLTVLCLTGCAKFNYGFKTESDSNIALVKTFYSKGLDNRLIKNIYMMDFQRDSLDFADDLTYSMRNVFFNGKRYFNVQRRDDLALVFNHEKSKVKSVENKTDDVYYINGEIFKADYEQYKTFDEKVDYDNCLKYSLETGKCMLYSTFRQECNVVKYELGLNVKVRVLSNSNIVFDKFYKKNRLVRDCGGEDIAYAPNLDTNLDLLSKKIAHEVVDDFTPKRKIIAIPFSKKLDIDFTKEEKFLLLNAIETFEKSKEEALVLFEELLELTNSMSSTVLFNYALCLESLGDDKKSMKFYKKALLAASLQESVNGNIISSIERVEDKINYKGLVK